MNPGLTLSDALGDAGIRVKTHGCHESFILEP